MTTIKKKIYQIPALLFLFSLLGITGSMAQMPGGITTVGVNPEFWLRADMVNGNGGSLPDDGKLITLWQDVSSRNKTFSAPNTSAYPRFSTSKPTNYHPAVLFDTQASRMLYPATGQTYGNSYYLFYVSKQSSTSKTAASIFDFYDSWSYNLSGWIDGKPYFRSNNRGYTYPSAMQKDINIVGIIRPSVPNDQATPSNRQLVYLNGASTLFDARTLSDDVGTDNNIIGASKNSAASNNFTFKGDIMEVILLQGAEDTQLLADDVNKVNSYLAVKYGITLQESVSYVNSDGSTVWPNNATSIGYNVGVFGLVRDDDALFRQSQSTSTDKRIMTVFLGNYATIENLPAYNVNNPNTFANDKTYLMFGSNGAEGFSAYSDKSGFITGQVISSTEVTHKQNITYQVRLSGTSTSETVKIQPHMAATYVMVSTNPGFSAATTSLFEVQSNGIADVTFDYSSVGAGNPLYMSFLNSSTSPGGIGTVNLQLWLDASDMTSIVLSNGSGVQEWHDHLNPVKYWYYRNTGSNSAQNSIQPKYIEHAPTMNFHPAVDFQPEFTGSGTSDYKLSYLSQGGGSGSPYAVMSTASPSEYTFISAMYSRFENPYEQEVRGGYIMGFGPNEFLPPTDKAPGEADSRRPTIGVAKTKDGKGVGRYYEARYGVWGLSVFGTGDLFKANSTTISMTDVKKDTSVKFGFDGHTVNGTRDAATSSGDPLPSFPSYVGDIASMNTRSILGGGSFAPRNFDGLLGEVIAYERTLNSDEQSKLYSYLSLKYATTLDISGNKFDYKLSDNTDIWPGQTLASTFGKFHNNLAALIRDDRAHLNNRQARSTGDGAVLHMGIGNKIGTDPDLTGFEDDLQAIMWGHNGVDATANITLSDDTICGDINQRTGRIWMVNKVGSEEQEVILAAYGSAFPYHNGEVYLLVSSSYDGLNQSIWQDMIPMTYDPVTKMQVVNYTFPEGITYLAFGLKGSASSCEGCTTQTKMKINFSDWTNGLKNKDYDTGTDLRTVITIDDPSGVLRSGYPRKVSSPRSLRLYRSGVAALTTTIAFKDWSGNESAATAQFYIYDIDYDNGNYDRVEVTGYCNGFEVYPELDPGKGARSYNIAKNVLLAKKSTSGYASAKGRVNVRFDAPVDTIKVIYSGNGATTTNRWIGIGELNLGCAKQKPPAPPLSTDGMSFTKEAEPAYPDVVYTCEKVKYTYRIFNSHCKDRFINFSDTLDNNMKWVPGSLELDSLNMADAIINNYDGVRPLDIKGLKLTQGGEFKFSAYAEFEDNAPTAIYYNRANMEYERTIEGVTQTVIESSQDYWDYTNDSTLVNAVEYSDRKKSIEVDTMYTDLSCFIKESAIRFTLKFNNPNTTPISTNIVLYFNEEFNYVTSTPLTLTGPGNTTVPATVVVGTGDDKGMLTATATLPAGISTLEFSVKAPATLEQDYVWSDVAQDYVPAFESDGITPIYIPLQLDFELTPTVANPHICEEIIFDEANGFIEIPYCGSNSVRKFIITNKRQTMILRSW